jgi:hypothetical protein
VRHLPLDLTVQQVFAAEDAVDAASEPSPRGDGCRLPPPPALLTDSCRKQNSSMSEKGQERWSGCLLFRIRDGRKQSKSGDLNERPLLGTASSTGNGRHGRETDPRGARAQHPLVGRMRTGSFRRMRTESGPLAQHVSEGLDEAQRRLAVSRRCSVLSPTAATTFA